MGIPSDDDDDLEEEVKTETGFGCVVGEWQPYHSVLSYTAMAVQCWMYCSVCDASHCKVMQKGDLPFNAPSLPLVLRTFFSYCCSAGQPAKGAS